MRRRLALAFILVALLILGVFVGIRLLAQRDLIRDREASHLQQEAVVMARTLDAWVNAGQPLDERSVGLLVSADERAEVTVAGRAQVTVTGASFAPEDDRADQLVANASLGSTSVTMRQSSGVVRSIFVASIGPVLALSFLLVLLAGVLGYFASGMLSAPFRQLSRAAAALARGRVELDLPSSRIPEVRELAASLRASATRLQHDVKRDQEFLQDASHRLRTPMTGLRLELEDLRLREGLDQEVLGTVDRAIGSLDDLDLLTTEVFATARARRDRGGVQVTLAQLARQTAAAWSPALAERDVQLRVSVDGETEQELSPGPLEQVLELVLADLRTSGRGLVVLDFNGSGEQVSVQVTADARADSGSPARVSLQQVRTMVDALAGRCAGDPVAGGLRIWLLRR